jgi:hypothetical protein
MQDSMEQRIYPRVTGEAVHPLIPTPFFPQKIVLERYFVPEVLILFVLLAAVPADAGVLADPASDTFLLSAGNYSPDQVTEWRDHMPAPSYAIPADSRCFRYVGVFLPEESGNTSVDGYYARILPDGRTISYAEVRDADAPPTDPIAFRARAEACPYGSEDMEECFRPMITFFDGYTELARHTTVRNYPGIGEVAVTTILYHYPNDGDPDSEYFCTCSCIVETPLNASLGGGGWRNRGMNPHYHTNVTYGNIPPFDILATDFNPQTSHGRLRSLDLSGCLLGYLVTAHAGSIPEDEIFWNVTVGYFDELATAPLYFFPTRWIVAIQPSENDTGWRVLVRTDLDMNGGWARIGLMGYETAPASPDLWGHALLVRTVPEGSMQPTPRNDTAYLDIHPTGGRSVLLYPEDERYPAIDAECQELIQCIEGQLKTGFSQEELAAMKRNNTYVALRFPQPTTFETSYIVGGSPRSITINEAVFILDNEEEQNIIRTPAPDGPGVWTTSRDRGTLRDLVAPILAEGKKQ